MGVSFAIMKPNHPVDSALNPSLQWFIVQVEPWNRGTRSAGCQGKQLRKGTPLYLKGPKCMYDDDDKMGRWKCVCPPHLLGKDGFWQMLVNPVGTLDGFLRRRWNKISFTIASESERAQFFSKIGSFQLNRKNQLIHKSKFCCTLTRTVQQ